MSYTDPSGFFSLSDVVRTVISVAFTTFMPVIGGAIIGYLNTGTLQGAILGALGGAVSFGIGEAFHAEKRGQEAQEAGSGLTIDKREVLSYSYSLIHGNGV